MNYTTLLAAITSWTENQNTAFASERDQFIKNAERRIHMALQLPSARMNKTSNLTTNDPYLQIPSDVIDVLDLAIVNSGSHDLLRRKNEGFIREAYPDPTSTGTPVYYSVFDHNTILVGPTPNSAYAVEMTYHGVPTSIVSAATTWVGDNCERALLYGALVEAYTFMKGDPDLMQKYESAFQEELVKMKILVADKSVSLDMYQQGTAA